MAYGIARAQHGGGALNADTLVAVHCWQGDALLVEAFFPQYRHHQCPVVVLSPADSPVVIEGVECRSAGRRGYFGQESLDRQREHLKLLLEYPQTHFLLNDADSMCLSPELPTYLYENAENTLWSNEVRESRPHPSPYDKIGVHPPYFLTRSTIEKMLAVGPVEAHPITPFIDHMMLQLACEAGVAHRSYPDGKSFPAWRHGAIPETKELGHDYVHEQASTGVDGARRMVQMVRNNGVIFVHSVKHPPVRDQLVEAFATRRTRTIRPRPVPSRPAPAPPVGHRPGGELSLLVPFRDADGTRTRAWDFIRARLERLLPEAEIVVATDDGIEPFHKTLALNRAAAQATGSVFAIWDVDTWLDESQMRLASQTVTADPSSWVRPWAVKLKLNEAATDHVLSLGENWDGTIDHRQFGRPENRNTFWAGPPLVVHRSTWDAVGGMDERFRGWGGEDLAFATALVAMIGKPRPSRRAETLHLWHPRIGQSGRDLWVGQASAETNHELMTAYRRAGRSAERMRELLTSRVTPAEV